MSAGRVLVVEDDEAIRGVVKYNLLNTPAPVALGIQATGARWGTIIVELGTFAGLATTMLVMLMGQSRIFYSMSRDGLLPAWAGKIHPRFRTPWISSILVGCCVALFASLLPVSVLLQFTSIGTLLAFVIVCAGVLVLRYKRPDLARPFKTPGVPFVPIMGMLICFYLMYTLPRETWLRLLIWLLIGFVIYFTFGIKNSRLRRASMSANEENRGRTTNAQ